MADLSNSTLEAISANELHALAALQRLRSEAERSGHTFAARMITPSGKCYMVATQEPDNLAAWIFEQDDRALSSDPSGLASSVSRSRVARVFIKIRQVLSAIRRRAHVQPSK